MTSDFDSTLGLARARLQRSTLQFALLGSGAVALVITFYLAGAADQTRLLGWVTALVLAQGYGWILTFGAPASDPASARRWQSRYRWHFGLHGLAWLLAGMWLAPPVGSPDYYLLIVILAAMASGALISAGFDWMAAGLFAALASVPLAYQTLVRPGGATGLGLVLAVFIAYSFVISLRYAATLRAAEHARWIAARHADEVAVASRARESAEQSVRENDRRFRDFTKSASDWFWETDADGRFTYFTENYRRIFHVDPQRIVGLRREDLLRRARENPPELIESHLALLARHEAFSDFEYCVLLGDTGLKWISVSGDPYFDADGAFAGYRGSGHLTTERKLAERRHADAVVQAETASRVKSEFMASMSHELRTPLNAILGYAQLFAGDPKLSEENRELAGEIENAGEHLLALVNDVIDLSRIESGRLELSIEPVAVSDLVESSLKLVAPLAATRGVEIRNYSGGGAAVGWQVKADYVRSRQVLINFLSNAIKYNRRGGWVEIVVRG